MPLPHPAWLAPPLYMAGIIGLASIPGTPAPGREATPLDWLPELVSNLLHVPLYAGLALAWVYSLAVLTRLPPTPIAVLAFAAATVFGGIDELYQQTTPGRTASGLDVLLDGVGAALGVALYRAVRARRRRPGG